jgi:hypothetical protein
MTVLINIIGKVIIAMALFGGCALGGILPKNIAGTVGFLILFALGTAKIVSKSGDIPPKTRLFDIVILSVVLSIDGVALAIGAAVSTMSVAFIYATIGAALVVDQVIFALANLLAKRVRSIKDKKVPARKINLNIVAGILIIIVAFVKLLFHT